MVVFEDGLARKGEYRRFVIRGVDGQNDVASMDEVITRRFRRLLDEQATSTEVIGENGPMLVDPETGRPRKFAYAPGLVVVDGGPPQVAAAQRALSELGIVDIPVCGLAKRLEEVWLPDQEDPVILARSSEGLYLLQRIRDEAHRFAITHHRSRRSKTMVESLLDDVPGLGEVRRKTLLKHFGSLKKLRAATVEEIAMVPGIGERTATAIKDAVAQQSAPGPARLGPASSASTPPPARSRRARTMSADATGPARRARRRDRHDRRRAQHRGQGARGPRLLRRRQHAAEPAARRRPPRRREPRHPAAGRGRRRRTLRLVLRVPAGQPRPRRDRAARHAGVPRGHRRRARTPPGGRPPAAPAAGHRAGCSTGCSASARCSPTCAATPTSSSTPPASTCTSSPTGSPRRSAPPTRGG